MAIGVACKVKGSPGTDSVRYDFLTKARGQSTRKIGTP